MFPLGVSKNQQSLQKNTLCKKYHYYNSFPDGQCEAGAYFYILVLEYRGVITDVIWSNEK